MPGMENQASPARILAKGASGKSSPATRNRNPVSRRVILRAIGSM